MVSADMKIQTTMKAKSAYSKQTLISITYLNNHTHTHAHCAHTHTRTLCTHTYANNSFKAWLPLQDLLQVIEAEIK